MKVFVWILAIWIAIVSCVFLVLAVSLINERNPLSLVPLLFAAVGFFGSIGLLKRWPCSRSAAGVILVTTAYSYAVHTTVYGYVIHGPEAFWNIFILLWGSIFLWRDYQRSHQLVKVLP